MCQTLLAVGGDLINSLLSHPGIAPAIVLLQETFEQKVNNVLNKARDDAGNMAQQSLTLHVSFGEALGHAFGVNIESVCVPGFALNHCGWSS